MWHCQLMAACVRHGSIRSRVDGTTLIEALIAMGLTSVVLASGMTLQLRLSQGAQNLAERTQAVWFLDGLQSRLQVVYPRYQGTFRLMPEEGNCFAPTEDATPSLPAVLDAWYGELQCVLPGVAVMADLSPDSRELRLFWPDRPQRPPIVIRAGHGSAS